MKKPLSKYFYFEVTDERIIQAGAEALKVWIDDDVYKSLKRESNERYTQDRLRT